MIDAVSDTMRDHLSDAIGVMDDIISVAPDMMNLDNHPIRRNNRKDLWLTNQMAVCGKILGQ
ncbi:hypothetical protein [uncultured Cohaesibacter sp.]|uniref:hypothetical protein n=1 Tax=uncultured Cohaesibacter sp. TaxID=1002546 RepID=UPI0029C8E121|nr:hypothetical protein [uncultured Cohaesibacter sp.]